MENEEEKKDNPQPVEAIEDPTERQMESLLLELVDSKYWQALEYFREKWLGSVIRSELGLDPLNKDLGAFAVAVSRSKGQRDALGWYNNRIKAIRERETAAQQEQGGENEE